MRPGAVLALRAVGALAVAGGIAAGAWLAWDELAGQPIVRVRFGGDAGSVPAAARERLAAGLRGRPAREVSLAAVREAVRHLPWVRDCTVRYVFPGTLDVAIVAHVALARWDEARLVSVRGEVFAAGTDAALPIFSGPEGSAAEMAAAWERVARAAAPLGIPVAELRLSARRAWQARLASGLALELGREDIEARLARFAAAWPRIEAQAAGATRADLRYPNGFALRGVAAAPANPAPRGAGRQG
ncbi:MAG: cell division protein FtsQ/DivIB [Burkholderiales bacterium]